MGGTCKAIIFDLDGTLLYTLEDLADSLNDVLREEGLPTHPDDAYRFMVGNGLEKLVIRALPEALRVPAHVRPVLRKFSARYRENQCRKTRPYPGMSETLEGLAAAGLRLAVLSNKAHPNAVAVVEHYFPGRFQAILGLRPEAPAKPDPAGVLEIAEKFGLRPEDFLYLGDRDVDMKTAAAAGCLPVGAGWGYRPREELLSAGARVILAAPEELLGLIHE
jgi:phosphoglycolate phosphatase